MSQSIPDADASKSQWRDWARATRAELDFAPISDAVISGLLKWEPMLRSATVLLYLPMPGEINLQPLVESNLECKWLTTRTPDAGRALTIHELGGPLQVHRYGYLQPHPSAPEVSPAEVDVVLVPGLVFDLHGTRLGHGAGFYDRLLARMGRQTLLAGVVPVDLVVDRLPAAEHDVAMTHLATEEGVVETARR